MLEHTPTSSKCRIDLPILRVDGRDYLGLLEALSHGLVHVISREIVRQIPKREVIADTEAILHNVCLLVRVFVKHFSSRLTLEFLLDARFGTS